MKTPLNVRLLAIGVSAFTSVVLGACRGPTRVSPPPPAASECLIAPPGAVPETVTVALFEAVDPGHAPYPRNPSERIVFRHLYEPLIRLDCRGEPYAALAAWDRDGDGRRWRFVLREDARFWSGASVSPTDVIAGWVGGEDRGRIVPWARRAYREASIVSDRILAIRLPQGARDVPAFLAHPGLAVARPGRGSPWPEGTGPYRVEGGDDSITLRPTQDPDLPIVRFRIALETDPRDLLDGRVDLLVTRDPATIEYAATVSGYRSQPLTWDRTYVLASANLAVNGRRDGSGLQDLARDAVRAEARVAEPLNWLDAECGVEIRRETGLRDRPTLGPLRIVYPRGDAIARGLAERLVALTGHGRDRPGREAPVLSGLFGPGAAREPPVAAGLDPRQYSEALGRGADAAYVVGLPRNVYSPCDRLEQLLHEAPWLGERAGQRKRDGAPRTPQRLELDRTLVPLIDVRAHVVLSGDISGVWVDWDGALLITGTRDRL